MDLNKLGFKFFAEDAEGIDILEFIPVFHRWIQNNALPDLLIDAADYSHVPDGAGIILVAHEGTYAFDETGGRRGVLYYSKRPLPGDLDSRLATVCRKTLQACQLLTREGEFKDALRIRGNELQFIANDRLLAPNTDETYGRLEPALRRLLDTLFAGAAYRLEREPDPKERFSVTVRAEAPVALDTLLARLPA